MTALDERTVWFDYDALEAYDDTDVSLFCLSDRDLSIVLSCLRYATWTARWYGNDGQRLRDSGRPDDLESAIDRAERLISRLMEDKCADLSTTFGALVDALGTVGGGGCGCGSGGAGSTDEPQSGSDWGDINDPPDPEVPPDGFESWAEYKGYKCDVATWILDNMIEDCQWLQTVDLVTFGVAGLAFGLLTPIPGDALFAVLAAILAATAVNAGWLATATNALINGYDDLLCALYLADNAGQARTDFDSAFSDAVDAETASAVERFAIKNAMSFFVTFISVNKMFDRDANFESQLPTGDCSQCGIPQWWDCGHGTVIDWGEDYVDVEAIPSGSDWLCTRGLSTGPGFENTIIAGSHTPPSAVPSFASAIENTPISPGVSCGSGNGADWDITSGSFLGGPYPSAAHCLYRSGTQMTVRFTKLT